MHPRGPGTTVPTLGTAGTVADGAGSTDFVGGVGVVGTGGGVGVGVHGSLYPPVPVDGVVESAELFVGVVAVSTGEGDAEEGVGEGFVDSFGEAVTVFVTVTFGFGGGVDEAADSRVGAGGVLGADTAAFEGFADGLRAGGVVAVGVGTSAEVGGVAAGGREVSGTSQFGFQLEAVVLGDGFSSTLKGSA